MTYFSLEFALILLQNVSKTTVIASQYAYWRGNPFPTMRSIVSAYRADNITPVNDNLHDQTKARQLSLPGICYLLLSSQKATALAAATFRESTP